MAKEIKSPLDVVQTDDQWYCAVRKLRAFVRVSEESDEYIRPFVLLVVDVKTGLILVTDAMMADVSAQMAYQKLAEAMIHPLTKGNGAAHRPALIHFEDEALMEAVRPLLAELEVKVFYQTQRRGIDEIVKDLEKSLAMFGEGNIPGLLQLNPKDNQGVRYLLLDLLIDLGKDEQARALLNEYQDDWSARFAYATALLALREQGDSREANQALTKAIGKNAHVLQYLTGAKQIPMEGPKIISMGGEDEAVDYAREQFDFWRKTPGAIDWLKNKVSAEPKRKKK